jgi:hypothetical protein
LVAEAIARGIAAPPDDPRELTAALYASSRREVAAMHAALNAASEVPASTGPYNPVAIAAQALAELAGLAPRYLAALVGHLDELAPLLALPPAPATPARRGGGGGRTVRRRAAR